MVVNLPKRKTVIAAAYTEQFEERTKTNKQTKNKDDAAKMQNFKRSKLKRQPKVLGKMGQT